MNLFNYLMAKKGHNTSVRDDLFAYLLGKRTPKEVKTATGTTISISDVTSEKIVSLTLSKESTQETTSIADGDEYNSPSPEHPQEIKTVKGYRNLLNNPITSQNINGITVTKNEDGSLILNGTATTATSIYNAIPNGLTLSAGTYIHTVNQIKSGLNLSLDNLNDTVVNNATGTSKKITLTETKFYQNYVIYISANTTFDNYIVKPMITEGTEELPYVPYGTNWIYTAVSNGTDTNYYTIPLNGNEIAGIGDYKDELIVDKNGHCWLNKKLPSKNVDELSWSLDSTNKIFSALLPSDALLIRGIDFLSTICKNAGNIPTNNLQVGQGEIVSNGRFYIKDITHTSIEDFVNILSDEKIYYSLATPQPIDLNYDVDVRLFNGINNISNSDDMDMTLKYY